MAFLNVKTPVRLNRFHGVGVCPVDGDMHMIIAGVPVQGVKRLMFL